MAGLKGQWDYAVDAKGRLALPAKLRRAIRPEANDVLTITRGFEPCLYAYPSYEWENVEAQLSGLNSYQRDSRMLIRTFLGWADDATIDGQGRIALSKRHLEFAGITDRVVVVGALNRIEIWSPERLEQEIAGQPFAYDDLAEFVLGGSPPPTSDTDTEN
ncbi:MAG: division/cell wall cluster transcriptional repressor MraZ [Rhodothermia bacterium]